MRRPVRCRRLLWTSVLLGAATAAGSALAGPDATWRPTTSGPFVTMTAPLAPRGALTLQPLVFAAFQNGSFDSSSRLAALEGSGQSLSFNLFAEYTFAERSAAGAQLTVLHNRRVHAGQAASATGVGDGLVFVRHELPVPQEKWLPALSVLAQAKVPLGKARAAAPSKLGTDLLGTGTWDLTAGIDLTEYLEPVVLHLDLFASASLETSLDGAATQPGPAFVWAASAEVPLPLPFWPHRWGLMVEVSGRFQAEAHVEGRRVPGSHVREVTLGAGVELIFSDGLQALFGYQRTLWGTNIPSVDTFGVTLVPAL